MTRNPPSQRRAKLRHALGREFARGVATPWEDDRFGELALEIFRYQVDANPVYGSFVRNRGIEPASLGDWREIPPVPTRAFKELPLVCAESRPPEAVFRTSGTSLGSTARGEHRIRDLSLYRASLLASAGERLQLRGSPPKGIRLLALLPSPKDRPDSSLSAMAGAIAEVWDDGEGGFFARPDWELRIGDFEAALARAVSDGAPLLLFGTAFSFLHWLDSSAPRPGLAVPEGSVLVETGGFKGRSRELSREELYRSLQRRLGIHPSRMVNEYGMTEMLSQFYEAVLDRNPAPPLPERWHVGPPWVRTRILDPATLAPVAKGEAGLLAHFDLANLDSVAAILTEDVGVAREDGFHLYGRVEGAEPRGCSLSMEELLFARGAAH